jgi:hypothetical protein
MPDLIVEIDWTTSPLAVPHNWTDISARVRGASLSIGRQQQLGRTEVGGGSLLLDNRDRYFDPTVNAEVLPMRHIRLRAQQYGITYDLARGYVRSWPQDWPGRVDAVSEIEFEDAFSILARYEMAGFTEIAQVFSGEHISRVLSQFGWPTANSMPTGVAWWLLGVPGSGELDSTTVLGESSRVFDSGRVEIKALIPEGNLLEHILNVAEDAEGGIFYVGPSGELVFQQHSANADAPIATFGDGDGELRMYELSVAYDDEQLWTIVRVSRGTDPTIEVSDSGASDQYGPRVLERAGELIASPLVATDLANDLLGRYSTPRLRPERLVVRPRPQDPELWDLVLLAKLNDHLTVNRRPPGGGDVMTLDCRITGIDHSITPGLWETTFSLQAVEPTSLLGWLLETPGRGELDSTTTLGW